jgi:hypothetical protein
MKVDLFIKPVALWEILDKFQKVAADCFPEKTLNGWNFSTSFGSDSINVSGTFSKDLRSHDGFKQKLQEYKKRSFIDATHIHVTFHNGWTVHYVAEENNRGPFLRLDIPDHQRDRVIEMTIGDALSKHFVVIPRTEVAASALSETQLKGFRFAEQVVAALASETAKIATSATTSFEDFVAGVKQRSLELEDSRKGAKSLKQIMRQS